MTQTSLTFEGPRETPSNVARLTGQIRRVAEAARDRWLTLSALATAAEAPEASVSAQLRHLRKDRFGGSVVERRHLGNGLYEYRLLISAKTAALLEVGP